MILWVKSVPQHHLSLYTGHHKRTEVARSWGEVSLLLFAGGELQFLALKSSSPSHSPLQVPSDGTAGRASTICPPCMCSPCDAWQWEGRVVPAGACCPCCCPCSPCAGQEQPRDHRKGSMYPAGTTAKGDLCQGKAGPLQHHSWVLRAELSAASSHTPASSLVPLGAGS